MEPIKYIIEDVDLSAEVGEENPESVKFTMEGGGIYMSCYIRMEDVIHLHAYLGEEIETWLKS